MIVYQSNKNGFLKDVLSNSIENIIDKAFYDHLGRHTSFNEVNSWRNSLNQMYRVLTDEEIPGDAAVSVEFQIPLTSKRIDFILTGLNENQKEQVIIIELKQWSSAELTDKDAIVRTWINQATRETAHPSYQAWSYAAMIEDFNETVRTEPIALIPCAYLHNYEPDQVITHPFYSSHLTRAPVFLRPDAIHLRNFIKRFIKYGDQQDILYKIENGRIRPSKQLADSLASMLQGNREFIMLDDQKLVYETALQMAQRAKTERKQVLIVEGGPGTGKSVVAINLLVELTRTGLVTRYVSKNAAPRAVYEAMLTGTMRKSKISNLFGGTGSFIDMEPNTFDNLIVDEAHRLNLQSGLYGNQGENQALEIINSAKFTIFFIDDKQRIHIKDIGTKKQLKAWAKSQNAIVKQLKLSSQFRCNGSDAYLAWLDHTLQVRETANITLDSEEFDFRVFSDPNELRKTIIEKNAIRNKARMVAGYCWDWKSKNDSSLKDVTISEYNFGMTWNLTKDGSTWIIAENSVNEIGCIHTCQGLELDYIGVIIGSDLTCRKGKIITDVGARSGNDRSIRGIKTMLKDNPVKAKNIADSIIKNTYRTLLTRGIKGCYIYCCDKELEEYFRSKLTGPVFLRQPAEKMLAKTLSQTRIEQEVNEDVRYLEYLPYYSIKAACGAFGDWQVVDEEGWVKVEGVARLNRSMFVIRAVGHSMEPLIEDGDLCVFRANVAGSRTNKIVLVQHHNHYDTENQGSYSIKKYRSEKSFNKDTGEWKHEQIVLHPLNPRYEPIIINEDEGFMVIGEFIGVVNDPLDYR